MTLYQPQLLYLDAGQQVDRLIEIRDKLIAAPATEETLADIFVGIQNLLSELQLKANLDEVQEVSLETIPLAEGAATATNQTTQITTLGQIRDRLEEIRTYTDSLELLLTSLNGYVDGLETLLGTANTTQSAIAGFVDQLEGFVDGIEPKLDAIVTNQPKSKGAGAVDAETQRVTLASDGTFAQAFGTKSDDPATTDTGNTGFISLAKRWLQQLTAIIGLLPTSLANGRFKVEAIALVETCTPTSATVGIASNPVLAANPNRVSAIFINNSINDVFLSRSGTAVLNAGILLKANGGAYEINSTNLYKGTVSAIATAANSLLAIEEGI